MVQGVSSSHVLSVRLPSEVVIEDLTSEESGGLREEPTPTAWMAEDNMPMSSSLTRNEQFISDLDALLRRQQQEVMRRIHGFVRSRSGCTPNLLNSVPEGKEPDGKVSSCRASDQASVATASWNFDLRETASHNLDASQTCRTSDQASVATASWNFDLRETASHNLHASQISFRERSSHAKDKFLSSTTGRPTRGRKRRPSIGIDIGLQDVFGDGTQPNRVSRMATMQLARIAETSDEWRARLLRLSNHWKYELAVACLIFINAVVIAWETDSSAKQARLGASSFSPIHFQVFMYFFCLMFAIDVALRVVAQGTRFFYSMDWKWNVFDVMVVLSSVVEVIVFLVGSDMSKHLSNAQAIRVVRVVRVVRLARVARLGRALRSFVHFRTFRITIAMLVDAVVPLASFSSIMAMILLVFAIFFTDGATGYLVSEGVDDRLVKYYGSLLVTMATLYKAISGGLDWESAVEPLEKLSGLYTLVFFGFVTFSFLAMLNVISAMFVQSTLQRAKNDRDFVVQTEIEGMKENLRTMQQLFDELDHDGSGIITQRELQDHIMDPNVNAYFRAIDLDVYKVKELFRLIDVDNSGGIDRREFTQGCIRLRGEAKELDVAIIQSEQESLLDQVLGLRDSLLRLDRKLDAAIACRPSH